MFLFFTSHLLLFMCICFSFFSNFVFLFFAFHYRLYFILFLSVPLWNSRFLLCPPLATCLFPCLMCPLRCLHIPFFYFCLFWLFVGLTCSFVPHVQCRCIPLRSTASLSLFCFGIFITYVFHPDILVLIVIFHSFPAILGITCIFLYLSTPHAILFRI